MKHEFFMAMNIPTTTHQQKKVRVVKGKPIFYEPQDLKAARSKFMGYLMKNKPKHQFVGPTRLITKWCYFTDNEKKEGQWKDTKPDTDNMIKLLKDCMTACSYWIDDSIVTSEITEKFWSKIPGIYIYIESL